MERRKFLLGAGSAAVGTSAVVGSGAFTSVSAERTIDVSVAGDDSAFLAVEPADTPNGDAYAEQTGDTVELNFDGTADFTDVSGTGGGSGINDRALVEFANVLTITNQGTQDVGLKIEFAGQTSEDYIGNLGGVAPTGPILRSSFGVTISPGESQNTGVYFNQKQDANFGDYIESIDTMTILADADEA
jgi:hypothetical protein